MLSSWGEHILGLVLVSSLLQNSDVCQLPPVVSSNHMAQLLHRTLHSCLNEKAKAIVPKIDFDELNRLLLQVFWPLAFRDARNVDKFVDIFAKHKRASIEAANHMLHHRRLYTRSS